MSTPSKRKSFDQADATTSSQKPGALSPRTIEYLRAWMMSPEHIEHPYPTEEEKDHILADTGITAKQLTCWFSNNRKRFWKPKMEEMGKFDVVEAAMGSSLSNPTIEYLKAWMLSPEHIQNPYPTEEEKVIIMTATGIGKKQLTCWFSNNRKRLWKPKMDKIRKQYGLSEADPLPAAAVASVTVPAPTTTVPSTTAYTDPEYGSMLDAAPAAAPSGDMYVAHSNPVAAIRLNNYAPETMYGSAEDLYASMKVAAEAAADEHISGEQADNKRQRVSLDDIVAV